MVKYLLYDCDSRTALLKGSSLNALHEVGEAAKCCVKKTDLKTLNYGIKTVAKRNLIVLFVCRFHYEILFLSCCCSRRASVSVMLSTLYQHELKNYKVFKTPASLKKHINVTQFG